MENERKILPQVGTSSSGGFSGASPAVSMMDDQALQVAGQKTASPEAERKAPFPVENIAAIREGLSDLSRLLDTAYQGAPSPVRSLNKVLFEATRANVEQAIRFTQDLASARSPKEFMDVNAAYWTEQSQSFTAHLQNIQEAFLGLVQSMSVPMRDEINRTMQRIRIC
jgi:hypothetical protein